LRVARTDLPKAPAPAEAPAAGALAAVAGAREGAPSAALGVVSFVGPQWRSLRGGVIDARIELDAALTRSSEGGLALDAEGRAFGMAVFGPRRHTLVIPFATIDRITELLATKGRIARGYLGLGLQPVKLDAGGIGAMATSVDAKGPSANEPAPASMQRWPAVAGADAVLFHRKPHTDPLRMWAKKLIEKKPFKLVAVALANKMARIAFAIMRGETTYREIPA
jgi:S1-C subfamily serine protease